VTTAAEMTGEFAAKVWPALCVERADTLISMPVSVVNSFPFCSTEPGAVVLPGGIRYRLGGEHPRRPGRVYLHRLDA
jgi:hypothetical protein